MTYLGPFHQGNIEILPRKMAHELKAVECFEEASLYRNHKFVIVRLALTPKHNIVEDYN